MNGTPGSLSIQRLTFAMAAVTALLTQAYCYATSPTVSTTEAEKTHSPESLATSAQRNPARMNEPSSSTSASTKLKGAAKNEAKPEPLSSDKDTASLVPGALLPDDPFAPYVAAGVPEILGEISPPPRAARPKASDAVTVKHLLFKSFTSTAPTGLVTNHIHAAIVTPDGPGPFPGVLVLHGGAGHCDVEGAVRWGKRGYIAVAIDLPSIGKPEDQISTGAWKDLGYGVDRFKVGPGGDVKSGKAFDAVVAGLDGFKLLQSLSKVDKTKLGIVGISWGGYMTTMLSSLLGSQVKAAYSIFGCGFYDKSTFAGSLSRLTPEERVAWVKYMDPGYRAGNIRAAFFFSAASNDNFFYPPAVMATFGQIPGEKGLIFVPNANHQLKSIADNVDATSLEKDWFAYQLKGEGDPFPHIETKANFGTAGPGASPSDTSANIAFGIKSSRPIIRAQIFYSAQGSHWKDKKWRSVDAFSDGKNNYTASIPTEVNPRKPGACWYVLITDDRNVSVSSKIHSFPFPLDTNTPK